MEPKDIVRAGYDMVSFAYRANDDFDEQREAWLTELAERIPPRARVLDLGCGCGIPAARWLVDHGFEVSGVDLSAVQIDRARRLVPQASFVCKDMTELDLPARSVDAITCLWAIIHVPLEEQPIMIQAMHRWLRPGGSLLITVGRTAWTGTENDWCGVAGATMYWSHEGADVYHEWLRAAGLEIEWSRFVAEGIGGCTLVLATAAGSRSKTD